MSEEFPDHTMTCIFTDGVTSLFYSPEIVKFFLGRFEPDMGGTLAAKMTPNTQVVLSIEAFVKTFIFFEARMDAMLRGGNITKEKLEQARAMLGKPAGSA